MSTTRISFRPALAILACCLSCVLLISACTSPFAHHKSAPKHTASSSAPPTAQQLIDALQKNFRTVSAFHVIMQVLNAGAATADQVQIHSANGDILMPDKVKAQASVVLSGESVQVNLISVGATQFITDPITGQWRVIKGVLDPRTLTNPDTGIISLISKVQNISPPTADNVNNVPCWNVTGQLDAKELTFLTGGGAPAGTMLQTSACVGQDDLLPYHVRITGIAAPGDTVQTTRTFDLSNYNESITISAPQV